MTTGAASLLKTAHRENVPPDVILIHPPSVFDFRERAIVFGPISDVIPSTPVFEMYPVGFLTLSAYLGRMATAGRVEARRSAAQRLGGETQAASKGTLNDKAELFKPAALLRNFRIGGILRLLFGSS